MSGFMLLLHDGWGGGECQLCAPFENFIVKGPISSFIMNWWVFFGALLSGPSAGCYSLNTVTFGIHWGRTKWKDYSTTDTNSHGHSDPVPSVCGQLQWFIWVLLCVCVCANWAFYRNWYMLTVFTSWVSLDLSDDLSSLTSLSSIHPPTCLYGPATTSSLSTTPKAFRGQPV